MPDPQFAQLKSLFLEVCELTESQARARLAEFTSDAELIERVMALATRDAADTRGFSAPIAAAMGSASAEVNIGDALGAWQLVAEIGRGGMGTVYRAERGDGHFQQTAAIKLLQGLPAPGALEHFAQERQILAHLNHPHIARLLDGGATRDGRPYLVMEYVEGRPISVHCSERRLARREILALFLAVCDAVGFAHQQLIVHCDLKPSNVLVNAAGRPVLLDFGIARLLDSGGLERPGDGRAFTPRYASPEQRAGRAISTSSDIYSLGCMLAELLADRAAPEDEGSAAKAAPNVELDALIARATAPDPTQRYASVREMAEDIERYLARRPLRALPRRPAYVGRKFLERNWPWVGAAAVFVLTVAGFTLRVLAERDATETARVDAERERGNAELARDAARSAQIDALAQRDRARNTEMQAVSDRDRAVAAERKALDAEAAARAEVRTTREVSNFMVSLFAGADPDKTGRHDVSAVAIVERGRQRIEDDLKGQPATQAAMFTALGRVYESIGRSGTAVELYGRAIEVERTLKPERSMQLAIALSRLALLKSNLSDFAGAEPLAREAQALLERDTRAESRVKANNLRTLGLIVGGRGRMAEAEALLLRAFRIHEKVSAPDSDEMNSMRHNLAHHYRHAGRYDLAETYYRGAMEGKARRTGEKHPSYLNSLEGLAQTLERMERNDEAESMLRKVLALRREMYGNRSSKVAYSLNALGRVVQASARHAEAKPLFEEALEVHAATSGKRSTAYAVTLNNLGRVLDDGGDVVAAEAAYREALSIRLASLPESDLAVAQSRRELGGLLLRVAKPAEAQPFVERAYEARLASLGAAHELTHDARIMLVDLYRQLNEPARGLIHLQAVQAAQATLNTRLRAALRRQEALLEGTALSSAVR